MPASGTAQPAELAVSVGRAIALEGTTAAGMLARNVRRARAVRRPIRSVCEIEEQRAARVLTSVTWRAPPVSFHTSQLSIVPNASSPRSARARAPGTCSSSQRELGRREVRIEQQAGAGARSSASWPAARKRSQSSAVRRSCQTIACATGVPVSRSQTNGGLALIGDADRGEVGGAEACALASTSAISGLAVPDFLRVVLDPAGLREDLRELPLRARDAFAVVIEQDGARAGRALIEREDVAAHRRASHASSRRALAGGVCRPSFVRRQRMSSALCAHSSRHRYSISRS